MLHDEMRKRFLLAVEAAQSSGSAIPSWIDYISSMDQYIVLPDYKRYHGYALPNVNSLMKWQVPEYGSIGSVSARLSNEITPFIVAAFSNEEIQAAFTGLLSANQEAINEEREKLRESEELQERLLQFARASSLNTALKELRAEEKKETGMTATEAYLAYKAKVEQGG